MKTFIVIRIRKFACLVVKKEFKPFVQNRVNEVRRNVNPENWFYCRTGDNPNAQKRLMRKKDNKHFK